MENNILHYYYEKQNKNINAPLFNNLIQTIISEENINLTNEKVIIFEDENKNRIDNEKDYNILIKNQSKLFVIIEDKILNSINKIVDNHLNPIINIIEKDNIEAIKKLNDIQLKLNNIESKFNSSIQKIENIYQKIIKDKENDELMNNEKIKQNNETISMNIKNTLNNNIDELKKINFSKLNKNLESNLEQGFNNITNSFNFIVNLVKDINNDIEKNNHIVNNNNKKINDKNNKFPIEKKQNLNVLITVAQNKIKISKEKIKKGKFKTKIQIKNYGNDILPINCIIEGKSNNLYCNPINLEQKICEGDSKEIELQILSSNLNTINNHEDFEIKLYAPQKTKEIYSCNIIIEIMHDEYQNIKKIIPDFNQVNKENESYEKKLIQNDFDKLNEKEKKKRIEEKLVELNQRVKEMGMNTTTDILRNCLLCSKCDIEGAINELFSSN